MSDLFGQYEERLRGPRQKLLERVIDLEKEPSRVVWEITLVNFCALGAAMTEPVAGWIRQAGTRCKELGFLELGETLLKHSHHEEGHDRLMIQDTRNLVERWNSRYPKKLDPEVFLTQPFSPGVQAYRRLHENVIQGEKPYAQIAIEYEIERLSLVLGPRYFKAYARRLGPDVLRCLSFLEEHIALDVGHTKYNQRALATFLGKNASTLNALVEFGKGALQAYGDYLEDCYTLAVVFVGQEKLNGLQPFSENPIKWGRRQRAGLKISIDRRSDEALARALRGSNR